MERLARLKTKGEQVYSGFYVYTRNQNNYLEEVFQVYRDHHDLSLTFFADMHGRVITGEILKIQVDYRVSKNFVPQFVNIRKYLGAHKIIETYRYSQSRGIIYYSFTSDSKKHEEEIPTHAIFSIAAPCSCTSFLFIKTKKEDTTSDNLYYVFRSYNKWKFEESPTSKPIIVQRESVNYKTINLKNNVAVQVIPYKVYGNANLDEKTPHNHITTYLAKHIAIPYLIQDPKGTKIQISSFSNFDNN